MDRIRSKFDWIKGANRGYQIKRINNESFYKYQLEGMELVMER